MKRIAVKTIDRLGKKRPNIELLMKAHIQRLDPQVANLIAAGEVIERPVAMVKELVENSIDAGATEITLRIQDPRNLTVRDNGSGISPDDLPLAFERHATSKIVDAADLQKLGTHGFRGEALASIGSAANVRLTSEIVGEKSAYQIHCEFGALSQISSIPAEGRSGTEIEIKDLFAQTPARRKFMKSDAYELKLIRNYFDLVGLIFPEITWRFETPKGRHVIEDSRTHRIRDFAKRHWGTESVFPFRKENKKIVVECFLAEPRGDGLRFDSSEIHLIVNGRPVRESKIFSSIMRSLRPILMEGSYPQILCFIQVPAEEIDVNVSPTKSEVRFSELFWVQETVRQCLEDACAQSPWLPGRPSISDTTEQPQALSGHFAPMYREPFRPEQQVGFIDRQNMSSINYKTPPAVMWNPGFAAKIEGLFSEQQPFHLIGQLFQTYIAIQMDEKLILVDQHAAQEKINYLKIQEKKNQSQLLLTPEPLKTIPPKEFQEIGFEWDELEDGAILRGIPSILRLDQALTFIKEHEKEQGLNRLERLQATLACHMSIRAGDRLEHPQMMELVKELLATQSSSHCPHGRPVWFELHRSQIEREFLRTV